MKTGMCTLAFKDHSFEDALDIAVKAGFDGVEPYQKPDHLPATYEEEPVRRAVEAVRKRNLLVSQLGAYANPSSETFSQEVTDTIRMAQDFGTDTIRVWAGSKGSSVADEADWKQAITGFIEYADRAADAGIRLAAEVHSNRLSDTTEGCMRLIEGVNRSNFRLNYQPTYPPDRVLDELRKVAPYVVNVHVHNGGGLLSEGPLDYAEMVHVLKVAGFDGFLEVEFVKAENPLDAIVKDAAFLRSLCEMGEA